MSDTPNFITLVPPANEWELRGMSVAIGALRISINSPAGGASCGSEARNQARRQAIMQAVAASPKMLEALTSVAEWWGEEVTKDKAGKPSLFTVPMYGAPACIFAVNHLLAELNGEEGQTDAIHSL